MFKKLMLASVLAAPAVCMAEGPSYTHLEVSYTNLDFDGGGKADGFGFGGSVLIAPQVFLAADYSMLSIDGGGDFNLGNAGIGFRQAVTETSDVVLGADVLFADAPGVGEGQGGYRVHSGLRAAIGKLELDSGVAYRELFDNSGFGFSAGGAYHFADHFAAIASAEFDEDTARFQLGGRYKF